jgi:hypothetical protein
MPGYSTAEKRHCTRVDDTQEKDTERLQAETDLRRDRVNHDEQDGGRRRNRQNPKRLRKANGWFPRSCGNPYYNVLDINNYF